MQIGSRSGDAERPIERVCKRAEKILAAPNQTDEADDAGDVAQFDDVLKIFGYGSAERGRKIAYEDQKTALTFAVAIDVAEQRDRKQHERDQREERVERERLSEKRTAVTGELQSGRTTDADDFWQRASVRTR